MTIENTSARDPFIHLLGAVSVAVVAVVALVVKD